MKKNDYVQMNSLILEVSLNTNKSTYAVKKIVNAFLDSVKNQLINGKDIHIFKFGKFKVRYKKGKIIKVHPNCKVKHLKGKTFYSQPRYLIRFLPFLSFRKKLLIDEDFDIKNNNKDKDNE